MPISSNLEHRRCLTCRRLANTDRGVILIEFALVLPVLLVIFIGLVEFSEAFTIARKLSTSATTVSDLVSQQPSVTSADLDDINLVANEIMRPYSSTPLSLVIVSVAADQDNATTVAWSYPSSAYAVGAAYALPQAGLTEPNSSIIVVEATYNFTPTVGHFLGSFPITQRAFFKPRFSANVAKAN